MSLEAMMTFLEACQFCLDLIRFTALGLGLFGVATFIGWVLK